MEVRFSDGIFAKACGLEVRLQLVRVCLHVAVAIVVIEFALPIFALLLPVGGSVARDDYDRQRLQQFGSSGRKQWMTRW